MERSPELRKLVILGCFVFATGITVSALLIDDRFWPHLLYIPVILASYCYRQKGVLVSSVVIGILFLMTGILTPGILSPVDLFSEWLVLVLVGGLVSYISASVHQKAERYGSLFEHSGVGICLISHPDFCITEVNPVFSRIFGYEACELVGSRFAVIWKKSEKRDEFFTRLRQRGEAVSEEVICHRPDRTEVRVVFSGRWISDETVICTARGMTDSFENEYQNSLDSIEGAIQIVDRDLNLVFSNAAHTRLCAEVGISCDEGRPLTDIFSFLETANLENYRQVFATGIPCQSEKRYETPAGPIVAEEIHIPVLHDGEVEHIVTVIRDMTAHRKAETALSRSEDLYRTVFETAGTAMMILEKDGTITLSNGEMEKTYGYRPGDVEGKRIWEFFASEEDASEVMLYHHERRKEGCAPPQTYESRLCDAMGMKHDVVLTVKMIPDTERCVLSILDVTAGKQAERLLRVVKSVNQLIVHEPDNASLLRKACSRFSCLEQAFIVSVSLVSDEKMEITAISDPGFRDLHESCLSSSEMAALIDMKVPAEFHEIVDADEGGCIPLRTLAIPMLSGGDLLGVLMFTTALPVTPGNEETELLRTLAGDLAFAIRSHEIEEQKCMALSQIEQNMQQFAILNDEIRNPLQGIVGLADLEGGKTGEAIIRQAEIINKLVGSLDQRWLESEKIRDFLHKHYGMEGRKR